MFPSVRRSVKRRLATKTRVKLVERENQGQVQGMLDAGVIQPPISERASAPVLVRKKDGQVQWCLDYRRLKM